MGGVSGYFPDGVGNKPWTNADPHSSNAFYNAKDQWFPTWKSPMAVSSVKVWTYADNPATYTKQPGKDFEELHFRKAGRSQL